MKEKEVKDIKLSEIPKVEKIGNKLMLKHNDSEDSIEDLMQGIIEALKVSNQEVYGIPHAIKSYLEKVCEIMAFEIVNNIDQVDEEADIYIIMDNSRSLIESKLASFQIILVLTLVKTYRLLFEKLNYNRNIVLIYGDEQGLIRTYNAWDYLEGDILNTSYICDKFNFLNAFSRLFNAGYLKSNNPLENRDLVFVFSHEEIEYNSIFVLENEEKEIYQYPSTRIESVFNMIKKWNLDLKWIQFYSEKSEEEYFTKLIKPSNMNAKTFEEKVLDPSPMGVFAKELYRLKKNEKALFLNSGLIAKGLSLFDFEKFLTSQIGKNFV